jgi:arsenite methyltransferase
MYADPDNVEFIGQRSSQYRDALATYDKAWLADVACMERFLKPAPGMRILEVGAGNGYFSRAIARKLGPEGLLVASDPSIEQLSELEGEVAYGNIRVVRASADRLNVGYTDFDAAWSRGAMHHVFDKTSAFRRMSQLVRPSGRLVIADIFAGTQLARYFDTFIARSCVTGHEVSYLSREFAASLCSLTGWDEPEFHEVITPWEFAERADIGRFLHLLFSAREGFSPEHCLDAADRLLSVTPTASGWALMWPMTVMVATNKAFS